jgi:hypothetical protein
MTVRRGITFVNIIVVDAVADTIWSAGQPSRNGLTTTVIVSPGLTLSGFQP